MTGLIITLTNINYEQTIFYMFTGKFSCGEITSHKAYPKALLLIILRNTANVDLKYYELLILHFWRNLVKIVTITLILLLTEPLK